MENVMEILFTQQVVYLLEIKGSLLEVRYCLLEIKVICIQVGRSTTDKGWYLTLSAGFRTSQLRFTKNRVKSVCGAQGVRVSESKNRKRAGMRREKRKEGKDPEGGSKKRKEAANGNFCYNAQLQTGKEIGLGEAAQAEPVRRSEKDTHDIQVTETVHETAPKSSADPKCIPKPFIPGAPCDIW
jgi:hypothetical protein